MRRLLEVSRVLAALALLTVAVRAAEAAPRQPVPAEAAQAESLKALKDIYKEEYAKRRTEDRQALARKLLDQGLATADDAVARWVFLREAADLAAKAGDVELGSKAVDALIAGWAVDAADERLRFFAAVGPAVGSLDAARAVVEATLAIVDGAVAADDYPLATRAATQADRYAAKVRDAVLSARTKQAVEDVKALADEFAALGELRDLLGQMTPAGHARYGRFLCFAKGDWEKGAAHLLEGDDAALKALVQGERAAQSAEQKVAAADGWYDWSLKQRTRPKREGLAHAGALYRSAVSGLTGLNLAKVDKRLAEIDKLVGVRGPRYPDGVALLLTFEAGTINGPVVTDLGPHRHQGRITGSVTPVKAAYGSALAFDGSGAITIANHPSLQIDKSMTVAMWLQPTVLGARRNPWNKAYGGEGTWTLEPTGVINGYYGTAGGNGSPYTQSAMDAAMVVNEWAHLAFVRDVAGKTLTWYKNGAQVKSEAMLYPACAPSPNDISIGTGYVGGYVGLIDEVALWPRALAASEIAAVYAATAAGRK